MIEKAHIRDEAFKRHKMQSNVWLQFQRLSVTFHPSTTSEKQLASVELGAAGDTEDQVF